MTTSVRQSVVDLNRRSEHLSPAVPREPLFTPPSRARVEVFGYLRFVPTLTPRCTHCQWVNEAVLWFSKTLLRHTISVIVGRC